MTKSVFSADLRIIGDVASKGDLDVHGSIEGTVSVRALAVARDAVIEGTVRAVSVEIAGRIAGRLECDHVAIESTGSLDGDVAYRTLSVVPGGGLNARCAPIPGDRAVTAASGADAAGGRADSPALARATNRPMANVPA